MKNSIHFTNIKVWAVMRGTKRVGTIEQKSEKVFCLSGVNGKTGHRRSTLDAAQELAIKTF